MRRFEGQTAIVTGGARGIGNEIGARLAREGARLILMDLLEDEVQRSAETLRMAGHDVACEVLDITSEIEVGEVFGRVADRYGPIDVLVNSAGIIGPTSTNIADYGYADFQKVVEVNLGGAFLVCKAVIPHMLAQNYGRILLIASIGGKEGNPGMAGYAASKSGVIGLVKAVGKEYAGTGITVNGLAPAVIATPMNLSTDPRMLEYMVARIPMGRLGTVEEAAAISCWIVSPEASFNTGFIFDLSGGRATY